MLASNGEIEPPCGVPFSPSCHRPSSRTPAFQPCLYQLQHSLITDSKLHETHEPFVAQTSEEVPNIHLQNMLHLPPVQNLVDRRQRVMTAQPWPETERAFQKILLVNFIQNLRHRRLNRTINHRRNPDWTLSSIRLRDIHPANWRWRVTPLVDLLQNRR